MVEAFAIFFILPKHRKGMGTSFNQWVRCVAFGRDIPKLISDIPCPLSTKLAFYELDWKVLALVLFRCVRSAILQAHNEWVGTSAAMLSYVMGSQGHSWVSASEVSKCGKIKPPRSLARHSSLQNCTPCSLSTPASRNPKKTLAREPKTQA